MKTSNKIVHFGNCPKGLCLSYAGANLLMYLTTSKSRAEALIQEQQRISPNGGTVEFLSALIAGLGSTQNKFPYLKALCVSKCCYYQDVEDAINDSFGDADLQEDGWYSHMIFNVIQNGEYHAIYIQYYPKNRRVIVFDPSTNVAKDTSLYMFMDVNFVLSVHVLCLSLYDDGTHHIVLTEESPAILN